MHTCEQIYKLGAAGKIYGTDKGICRITGNDATGIIFKKWVRDTFTDLGNLKPGSIISNEALFCFDESSEILRLKANKEKPQRFRTYSHIVADGVWYCFTKANKREIYELLKSGKCEIVCLSDSGQKHLVFKHKPGMWQLEEAHVMPDTELLQFLHIRFTQLLDLGFSQAEIISGNYISYRVMKAGLQNWKPIEDEIKKHRHSAFFNFVTWIMYTDKVYEK